MVHSPASEPENHHSTSEPSYASGSGRRWGHSWRSSYWFVTITVGLGIVVDLLVYSIIVPVVPFQLQHLGYTGISALTGWLLFAYSAGLILSTIPIAMWSEHHNSRKTPMLAGLFVLMASQVLFMEAPSFAVMCVSRVIQGIGSSMTWTIGLAFLCDTTPKEIIGRQLGIAMSAMSIGQVLGGPLGGLLYSQFGFRGPFVFTLISTLVDLIFRLIILEPNEAQKRTANPPALPRSLSPSPNEDGLSSSPTLYRQSGESTCKEVHKPQDAGLKSGEHLPGTSTKDKTDITHRPLPLSRVVFELFKSPRALVALAMALKAGIINSSTEPALPLHLQSVWGLTAKEVGIFLLAVSVPSFLSSTISGWLTDKFGAEFVAPIAIILAIPWFGVITIQTSLTLFGIAFAFNIFFLSGAISPVTTELVVASRNTEGVGYAHIYAAFSVAYGIGTTVGPIIGGQMYDHIREGWFAICMLGAALSFASLALVVPYTGDKPLLMRLRNASGH